MEQDIGKKRNRLEELIRSDEILSAYANTVRDLEPRFEEIARSLSPQQRQVLIGYGECLKLMQLRMTSIVCQRMEFPE